LSVLGVLDEVEVLGALEEVECDSKGAFNHGLCATSGLSEFEICKFSYDGGQQSVDLFGEHLRWRQPQRAALQVCRQTISLSKLLKGLSPFFHPKAVMSRASRSLRQRIQP